MERCKALFKQDISRRTFWVLVVLTVAFRLLCTRFQMVYTWVGGAPLDDELMFRAAQSITAGQWLGPYDYLTLSKNCFFAVWLALIHAVGLPYLAAGQLLWCLASLAAAQAFAPAVRQYKGRLLVFVLLALNPATLAAYSLRVYRDNIFPALCLLFFAGLCGYGLRCLRPQKTGWPWLALCGLGLGCAALDREDGMGFLLPFWLLGAAVLAVAVCRAKGLDKRLLRCLLLALPVGLLGAGVLAVCSLNAAHYGVFALSDFSSGSFAQAIGAMNRVAETTYTNKVSIPTEVRELLYDQVEELAPLEYWLEEDPQLQNDFRSEKYDDYTCGSFYWAIRRAAQYEGVYDSAQTARDYWQRVADKINALCDAGVLPSEGGKRTGTTPPIRAEHVLPTLAEGLHGLVYSATFQGCAPYESLRSIGTAEDLALWEGYLHEPTNSAAEAGLGTPYYSPLQRLAYAGLQGLSWLWRITVPLLVLAALVLQAQRGLRMLRQRRAGGLVPWLMLLGLLGMAVLRSMMIGYVMVASFDIGTSLMYLATVHPLLILYGSLGVLTARGNDTEMMEKTEE